MQMQKNPMIDALRKQKGQGVDITIVLGDGESDEDKEQKELGLAPDGTDVGVDEDKEGLADAQLADPKQLMPGAEGLGGDDNDADLNNPNQNSFHAAMLQGLDKGMGPLSRAAMAAHKSKGMLK